MDPYPPLKLTDQGDNGPLTRGPIYTNSKRLGILKENVSEMNDEVIYTRVIKRGAMNLRGSPCFKQDAAAYDKQGILESLQTKVLD